MDTALALMRWHGAAFWLWALEFSLNVLQTHLAGRDAFESSAMGAAIEAAVCNPPQPAALTVDDLNGFH